MEQGEYGRANSGFIGWAHGVRGGYGIRTRHYRVGWSGGR
ncbi:hypothetical protein PSPO01_15250 [Paraphaeosphaeria sporulosa]